jgi:hypothetical protein
MLPFAETADSVERKPVDVEREEGVANKRGGTWLGGRDNYLTAIMALAA